MSMAEVLATVRGALEDADVGLAAATLSLAEGDSRIRADFVFGDWALTGTLRDGRGPNVMVRPGRWRPDGKKSDVGHRDATCEIVVGYEFFGAGLDEIQANVTLVATALAQVVDALWAYSDATEGTIYEVDDPLDYAFGQLEAGATPGATSNGFLATITIRERSTQ